MIDILIVGAGPGGLSAARALSGSGRSVRIIERDATPSPAGAGILLAGNAQDCLARFGLLDSVTRRGRWLSDMAITDLHGRILGRMGPTEAAPPGTTMLALHRRALHEALLEGVSEVPMTTSATVEALHPGERSVQVRLSSSEELEARLVVGADGIGSQVRQLAFADRPIQRRYAGYTCWRVVVPNPGLSGGREMWGHGQRIGLIPLSEGQVYAFLVADAPPGTPGTPTSAKDLRAQFSAFGEPAAAVLANIDDSTEILHHDIEDLSEHAFSAGRVALLGDAAHALTPNMGQGAAMAIEDAFVLSQCLDEHGAEPAALKAYAQRRRTRVKSIAQRSLRIGQLGQWRRPWACALRNALMRALPDASGQAQVQALVRAGPAHQAPALS